MDNTVVNNGKNIINDMTSNNKGDYLTKKVVNEVNGIISELNSIPEEISAVQRAVNQERERLIALKKQAEQENNN